MFNYTTSNIRNIALTGAAGAGKTSLVEALLYAAGAINNLGSLQRGTTVCDFDKQEKEYQHSLSSALAHLFHKGCLVNLIDTPGYPDFMGQTLSVFQAVETVAVVVNAETGIEMMTRRMLEYAAEQRLCRIIIVNKIDVNSAGLGNLLATLREVLGRNCLPINLPAQSGQQVIDCFFNSSGEADFFSVSDAHTQLIDQVVEIDEELMEIYLEQGGELNAAQLHKAFETALRDGHLIPICFVSARTGAGVKELLEVFNQLMPNPEEGNQRLFLSGSGNNAKPVNVMPDAACHALAHVFKVTIDPFVGKLAVFRIHQGTINRDHSLYIGDARKPFKVSHLFRLQGKEHTEMPTAIPGDICAVAKIDEIHCDAVLHDSHEEDTLRLTPIKLPAPMYGVAIHAKTRIDEQKISSALAKLADEDPCLTVEHNNATHETVLRGLGELHLRVMLERLKDRFNVEVDTHPPKIAYRETISIKAEGHHRHKKQTGGAGQFGEVFLRIEPLPRGTGFEFVDDIVGGVIPNQFIPAVEKGVRQILETGAIAGYPLQDVRVSVYDGKYHPVDSKEVAFVSAGKKAFIAAIQKAGPLVLEPIMTVEVITPAEKLGDITGSLSTRRASIQGTDSQPGGMLSIKAQVPLVEMSSYQGELKSITAGQGSFTLEFSHYQAVPANIQKDLMNQYRPKEEEN